MSRPTEQECHHIGHAIGCLLDWISNRADSRLKERPFQYDIDLICTHADRIEYILDTIMVDPEKAKTWSHELGWEGQRDHSDIVDWRSSVPDDGREYGCSVEGQVIAMRLKQ